MGVTGSGDNVSANRDIETDHDVFKSPTIEH
jgi:hypothetical protein